MKKLITYSLKTLGWIFLAVIFIVVVSGLAIQTKPVKKKLAKFAEVQASKVLNGNLTLGKIEGNFFTHVGLANILVQLDDDTLLFLPRVSADYNLWPLLKNRAEIHSIELSQPKIKLKQYADSTWNIAHLVKPSKTDTSSTGGNKFSIEINLFKLTEGSISIFSPDTLIPGKINHINTNLSGHYSQKQQSAEVDNFSFTTESPDLKVKKIAFNIKRDNNKISLADLIVQTSLNEVQGKGNYENQDKINARAKLESSPIRIQEFSFYLPGLEFPATPALDIDLNIENGNLIGYAELQDSGQYIRFDLDAPDFISYLNHPEQVKPHYNIKSKFKNINLHDWIDSTLAGYTLNGNLTLDGSGFDASTARVSLEGLLTECNIQDRKVDSIRLSFNLKQRILKGFANAYGSFGDIYLSPEIKNIATHPEYTAEIQASSLNLAELTGNDSLRTNLNLIADISGQNFEPEKINARATVKVSSSKIQKIQIDEAATSVKFKQYNLTIDSLRLLVQGLNIDAHGNYNFKGASEINLKAEFDSLAFLALFAPIEGLQSKGNLTAVMRGKPDSLTVQSSVNLQNTSYNALSIHDMRVETNGRFSSSDTLIEARINAEEISSGNYRLDSLTALIKALPDSVFIRSRISGNEVNSNFTADLQFTDSLKIQMDRWGIKYKTQEWALQHPAQLIIDSTRYRIADFSMASGNPDSMQVLSINGTLNRSGKSDLSLSAKNIDINRLGGIFEPKPFYSGLLNFSATLQGIPESPDIKGNFQVDSARINAYELKTLSGKLNLKDHIFSLDSKIITQDSGKLNISGKLPLYINLDTVNFSYRKNDSISLNLNVEKFPLEIVQELNISEEINGTLKGSVDVTGTLESPVPKGFLTLEDASMKIPKYGIEYKEAGFKTTFGKNSVVLDTLFVRSKDGNLAGTGQIEFSNGIYNRNIGSSEIKIKFNNFNPVDHRRLNMQLDGEMQLHGKKDEVVFDGNLRVPQSEIYLPFLMNLTGDATATEIPKPVLVSELEKMNGAADSSVTGNAAIIKRDTLSFNYLKNLTGKLKIKIPRNTWIKNEDMYLELSGDLELRKNREYIELFGTVDVLRGQYDILGKTFKIDDGTVTFRGGEEIKPEINITASNTFRNDQKTSQKLSVNVKGSVNSPTVEFTLDGNSISEGDALSYILFGKSMDELTINQQENVSGNSSLAANAAASLLSSQLTKFLGNKLNFDYIEVKSGEGFNNATLVVGKYITNNLFVSYEQRFGETNQKNLAKYEVKLEYELFKFLFLQLNNSSNDSGFDVVIKLDSK